VKSWFNLWKHYNHHFEYAKSLEKWCEENDALSSRFVYRKVKGATDKFEFVSLCDLEKEFIEQDKRGTFDFADDGGEVSCHCK